MPDPWSSSCTRRRATVLLLLVAACGVWFGLSTLRDRPLSNFFHDELHYWQQARDIADGKVPRYNRLISAKYPPLYAAVVAPARYFGSPATFPWWSRFINVLLAVSALIPAYRLARLFYSRGIAVVTSVIALIGPFQIYTNFLLSENLFVPLFLWLALALARMTRKGTLGSAVVLGFVLGLCILTKTLAVLSLLAIAVAVPWARRDLWRSFGLVTATTVVAGLVAAPWQLRALWIPGEAGVPVRFSYVNEFTGQGILAASKYVYWLVCSLGSWPHALGPITVAAGVAGLVCAALASRSDRRGLGMFAILTCAGYTVFTAIWCTQIEYYKAMVHERYLVFLFPLVAVAAPMVVVHGRRALLWGGALFLVITVVASPAGMWTIGSPLNGLIDAPSHPLPVNWLGPRFSPAGSRALYVGALGVFLLFAWRCRTTCALVALLGLAAGYQVVATGASFSHLKFTRQFAVINVDEADDWFATHVRPNDIVLFHTKMLGLAYHLAQLNEVDFDILGDRLTIESVSTVYVDRTGKVHRPAERANDRVLLLTRGFRPFALPLVSQHGRYRLYEVDKPIAYASALEIDGIWADRWCAPNVTIAHPSEPGGSVRVVLKIERPRDGYCRNPALRIVIRHGDEADTLDVRLGASAEWQGVLHEKDGWLRLAIEANGWEQLRDQRLSYRLQGLGIEPTTR